MIYPWHVSVWSRLNAGRAKQHHALLFHGPAGTGKRHLAEAFASALLCKNSIRTGLPCNACSDCHWFLQKTHPDFRLLTPDALRGEGQDSDENLGEENVRGEKKAAVQITIEQVRELQNFTALTTHQSGGKRVILIHPAETMNLFATNALLKLLEEPPVATIFLLVTNELRHLLPTIISRCQRVAVPRVERSQALAWLQEQEVADAATLLAQAGGAPLIAMAMADSEGLAERRRFFDKLVHLTAMDAVLDLAALYQKTALPTIVHWLSTWCYDLMASSLAGNVRYHVDYQDHIRAISKQLPMNQLLVYLDLLKGAVRSYTHPLNPRLFLEQLLLSYYRNIAISRTK